ncbi:MAG: cyclic nucleotide-binding domain-containing protein [Pseudomonadota bacterium]
MSRQKPNCHQCKNADTCLKNCLDYSASQQFQEVISRPPLFARGEYLFNAGDPVQALYIIRSGSIKLSQLTEGGNERVLGFYLPGVLLGVDGLADGVHSCDAMVLETTSVCRIPLNDLMHLCATYPALNKSFYSRIGKEVQKSHTLCAVLDKKNAEQRIAYLLLSLSEHFKHRGMSPTAFFLSMPRHDIASYLGLADETVSRAFKRLQEDEIINVEHRLIHILEPDALAHLASETTSVSHLSLIAA